MSINIFVSNLDSSFKYKPTVEDKSSIVEDKSPSVMANLSNRSWLSNSSLNDSMNQSVPSPSWVYMRGSPSMPQYQPQKLEFNWQHDSINDEQSLQKYLRNIDEKEKIASLHNSLENSPKDSSVFWNHPSTRISKDMSPMFKRTQYQLAPLNTGTFERYKM